MVAGSWLLFLSSGVSARNVPYRPRREPEMTGTSDGGFPLLTVAWAEGVLAHLPITMQVMRKTGPWLGDSTVQWLVY